MFKQALTRFNVKLTLKERHETYLQLTQLYMTHGSPLTWVEWLDKELFLTSDSGGSVHLHKWDLEKLTKKIHQGTYEDKEEPRRKFEDHTPFGVYQVKFLF